MAIKRADGPQQVRASDVPAKVAAIGTHMGFLDRFAIRRILGHGNFGIVYLAWDLKLARWVAIKVPKFSGDVERQIQRFLTEAQATAQLKHPGIAAIYDWGVHCGRPYLATEYVDGITLGEQMKSGPLPQDDALRIACEVANALQAAHDAGIIHRDVKPSNVMLDRQGHTRLMDFGLAKRLDGDVSLTAEGALIGTPAYLSPEQARAAHADVGPHSDQYSLAVVLFEMLTGRKPFDEQSLAIVGRIATEQPPKLRSVAPQFSKAVARVVDRGLALRSGDRYPSIAEFARDLKAELTAQSPGSKPAARFSSQSNRSRNIALSAAALTSLVVLGGLSIGLPRAERVNVVEAPPLQPAPKLVPPIVVPEPLGEPPISAVLNLENPPVVPDIPILAEVETERPLDVQAPEPKPYLPTYPAFIGPEDPGRRKEYVQLVQQMLRVGLKSTKKGADPDFKAARLWYEKAIDIAPHEPRAYYAWGLILHKRLSYEQAESMFVEARRKGGYPFLPAYEALVQYDRTNNKHQDDIARLKEFALALNGAHEWPDTETEAYYVRRLGQIAGFMSSGAELPLLRAWSENPFVIRDVFPEHYQRQFDESLSATLVHISRLSEDAARVAGALQEAADDEAKVKAEALLTRIQENVDKAATIEEQKRAYQEALEQEVKKLDDTLSSLRAEYDSAAPSAAAAAENVARLYSSLLEAQNFMASLPPEDPSLPEALERVARTGLQLQLAQNAAAPLIAQVGRINDRARPLLIARQQLFLKFENVTKQAQTQQRQLETANKKWLKESKKGMADTKSRGNKAEKLELRKIVPFNYVTEAKWINESLKMIYTEPEQSEH